MVVPPVTPTAEEPSIPQPSPVALVNALPTIEGRPVSGSMPITASSKVVNDLYKEASYAGDHDEVNENEWE